MKPYWLAFIALATGCSQPTFVAYEELANSLVSPREIARLDHPATQFLSSSDRTGANEDYNQFQGRTDDGELILADLKGPGVVSRFWFTGIETNRTIRFRFDGEKTPRLAFSWDDLRRGYEPFNIPPLAIDEQNCWHSYVPVPFRKRLLITTDDAGYQYGRSPKMYYQLNWQPMPVGQSVQSLSLPLPPSAREALERAARRWGAMDFGKLPELGDPLDVAPGAAAELWTAEGPLCLDLLAIQPDLGSIESASARDRVLREAMLEIFWNGHPEPSVSVPLGDFYGSVWQRWRSQSMYFGSEGDTFFTRFPMPFERSARVLLRNASAHAISLRIGVSTSPHPGPGHGYFHSGWRKSNANAAGTPHTVLATAGRGRYAGCILSVVSQDRSFWVLESDELMYADGAAKPFWWGTGLEDYFNAGWYYRNVFARPLHGLPNKAPFRTVQYRLHQPDPVMFARDFRIEFERGPDHASRADYESVSFYYLDQPRGADTSPLPPAASAAPQDPVQPYTLMTDLLNFERQGDLQGQLDYIDRYLESYDAPVRDMLALRRVACLHDMGRLDTAAYLDALAPFAESAEAAVASQAQALVRLAKDDTLALFVFYSNMAADLYLNGKRILQGAGPQQPVFAVAPLPSGTNALAIASAWQAYPNWVQVAVKRGGRYIGGTSGDWRHALNPSGAWASPGFDDSAWSGLQNYDARVKGPPEEPHVWVQPDAFVNTLSQSSGLRPSVPWPDRRGQVVYRKLFQTP